MIVRVSFGGILFAPNIVLPHFDFGFSVWFCCEFATQFHVLDFEARYIMIFSPTRSCTQTAHRGEIKDAERTEHTITG